MGRPRAGRREVGTVVEGVRTLTDLVAVADMEVGMAEDTEEDMVGATAEEAGAADTKAEEVVGGDTRNFPLASHSLFCLPLA